MKSRYLLIASGLFLIAALACVFVALRPPNDGVRIPVHAANGKMGYIDSRGKMVIDAKWDTAMPFGPDDRAEVSVYPKTSKLERFLGRWFPSLWSFSIAEYESYKIDRFGKKSPPLPQGCGPIELPDLDEMTLVEQGTGYRWIHKYGESAFPKTWQKALDFKGEDPAAVFKDGRWGFINRNGIIVLPFDWDETLGFNGNGRACVAVNGKWGVIDRDGRLVVPLYFKSLAGFDSKNLCAAQLASGWGFIDPNGKIQIPFRYRSAGTFDRFDMAKITITDTHGTVRCGWINRRGETVVQPFYQTEVPVWAGNFKDHELLPVIGPDGPGLIDRTGRTVVATAHGELESIEDPAAPGKFWIRTAPHRSSTPPPGVSRPPFKPVCYDQTGKVIWSDGLLASPRSFMILAVIFGLIAAVLFAMERLWLIFRM